MYLVNMMIASFFASLGFGVMFNIRGRKLILAGIAGSIGGVVYHAALLRAERHVSGIGRLIAVF